MAAAAHAVEITSKAMSAVLSTAAAAKLDMEGLLFGHVGEGCVVVQSFKLTGARWSACDAKGQVTAAARDIVSKQQEHQAVLGWCSIRRCGQASSSSEERSLRPTLRERCSQRGLQRHFRGESPWIALVLLQGPQAAVEQAAKSPSPGSLQAPRGASEGGAPALRLDHFCARGPGLEPVDLRIRSVGSTGGPGGGDRHMQPPPLLGPMRQVAEDRLLGPMNTAVTCVDIFAKQALDDAERGADSSQLSEAGAELRRAQREARRLEDDLAVHRAPTPQQPGVERDAAPSAASATCRPADGPPSVDVEAGGFLREPPGEGRAPAGGGPANSAEALAAASSRRERSRSRSRDID